MTKAAIDMVPRKLPGGKFTHTGAWAYLRANQLKHVGIDVQVLSEKGRGIHTDWSEFDVVYLYHTMDFSPDHPYTINVFDGPAEHTAKHFERIIWDSNKNVKYVSLDYPMPNYGYRCKRKRDRADEHSKMSDYWKNVDWDKVEEKCESITDWILDPGVTFTKPYAGRTKDLWINQCVEIKHLHPKITMGDSHAFSAYTPKSLVLRKDGRTLSGILKKGFEKEVTDYGFDWNQIEEITAYYGNIDIRHHIMRQADPVKYTKDLVQSYADALLKTGKKIELVYAIPIEDESRKLPSTGLYEGTPFYGSRAERQNIVKIFNEELDFHANKNGWSVFRWPSEWYEMDGLDFIEKMERPRSVHLAREYYRWDLENDCPNANLESKSEATKLLEF
jgi:hypothetical protein